MAEDTEKITNRSRLVPAHIERVLVLDEADTLLENEIRERSVIGDINEVEVAYTRHGFGYAMGWQRFRRTLLQYGAAGKLSQKQAFVLNGMFLGDFGEIILEHEIMEMVLYGQAEKEIRILETLGLLDSIRDHFRKQRATPLLGHYVGMIYELAEAHRRGLLDEHDALYRKMIEEVRPNTKEDNEFDFQFRKEVKKLLGDEGTSHA